MGKRTVRKPDPLLGLSIRNRPIRKASGIRKPYSFKKRSSLTKLSPSQLSHLVRSSRKQAILKQSLISAPSEPSTRVMSWNTQGEKASEVMRHMSRHGVDVGLIQESGPITSSSSSSHSGVFGETIKKSDSYRYSRHQYQDEFGKSHQFYRALALTSSKHMAVWSKQPIDSMNFSSASAKGYARAHMQVETGGLSFLNAHSPSDSGHSASKMSQDMAFGKIVKPGGVDVAGGDWNRSPPTSFSPGVSVSSSGQSTQKSGGELDYFAVSSKRMKVTRSASTKRISHSDHNPVFMDVQRK